MVQVPLVAERKPAPLAAVGAECGFGNGKFFARENRADAVEKSAVAIRNLK
jgi:hypothetical protein